MCSYVSLHETLKSNKNYFPQNECDINRINRLDNAYDIVVKDDHCPICEDIHDDSESYRFLEVRGNGKAGMKCTHESCHGKMCPKNGISIINTPYHKNVIFCNNYGTIINNNYKSKKSEYTFKLLLQRGIVFIDDIVLNKLLLDALLEDSSKIAKLIAHNNDGICFCDTTWHQFDGFRWKKYDGAVSDMIKKFKNLFELFDKKIMESELITDDEKCEFVDHIDNVRKLVDNPKKNTNVLSELKLALSKNMSFDANLKLFAFDNGVYDFDKMAFRPIESYDMIKKTCGYNFINEYENKQLLMDELTNMFPDKETLHCFLNYVALGMAGKNNLDIILILQWMTVRFLKKMKNMLVQLFGEYAWSVESLSNIVNIKTDLSRLETIRFLSVTSMNHVTSDNVSQIIDSKSIEIKKVDGETENINLKCAILGMSCDELQIDHDIVENIAHVVMVEKKFKNIESSPNDLFLLLIEYLNYQGCDYDKIKFVQNDDRNDDEKIYDEFIQNCLVEKKGNKEKASDLLIRFFQWKDECKKNLVANSEQKIRTGLNTRIKLVYEYKLSMRIGPCTTSGFIDVKCTY